MTRIVLQKDREEKSPVSFRRVLWKFGVKKSLMCQLDQNLGLKLIRYGTALTTNTTSSMKHNELIPLMQPHANAF